MYTHTDSSETQLAPVMLLKFLVTQSALLNFHQLDSWVRFVLLPLQRYKLVITHTFRLAFTLSTCTNILHTLYIVCNHADTQIHAHACTHTVAHRGADLYFAHLHIVPCSRHYPVLICSVECANHLKGTCI